MASTTTAASCPLVLEGSPTGPDLPLNGQVALVPVLSSPKPGAALPLSSAELVANALPARFGASRGRHHEEKEESRSPSLLHGGDGASAINKRMGCEHVVNADTICASQCAGA